jgi:hypothetical protein
MPVWTFRRKDSILNLGPGSEIGDGDDLVFPENYADYIVLSHYRRSCFTTDNRLAFVGPERKLWRRTVGQCPDKIFIGRAA